MIYLSNFGYNKLMKTIKEVQQNTKYFKRIKETNDNILVSCPYHKGGQENKPSCGIHIKTLVYHCFSCGAAGSFFDMMQDIYMPIDESQLISERDEIELDIGDREVRTLHKKKPEVVQFDYTVGLTKYLQKRQLTHEVCEEYIVGYKDDLVVFPTRNMQGEIIFYVTRNVYKKEYTLSKDDKPIYGLYELFKRERHPSYCFIVESPINALTLRVWGFNAVALMGLGSQKQLEELFNLPIREFILCFDGDQYGRDASVKLSKFLTSKLVKTVLIYEGKDVNDLSREEFSKLLLENNIKEEELK